MIKIYLKEGISFNPHTTADMTLTGIAKTTDKDEVGVGLHIEPNKKVFVPYSNILLIEDIED